MAALLSSASLSSPPLLLLKLNLKDILMMVGRRGCRFTFFTNRVYLAHVTPTNRYTIWRRHKAEDGEVRQFPVDPGTVVLDFPVGKKLNCIFLKEKGHAKLRTHPDILNQNHEKEKKKATR
jgi:hypothetical protein